MSRRVENTHGGRAIRSIAVLHILMLAIISAGILLNIHLFRSIMENQRDLDFLALSESLAFSVARELDASPRIPVIDDSSIDRIRASMRMLRLNSRERLYIATRRGCHRVFPERIGPPGTVQPVRTVAEWQPAWKGTRLLTPPYLSQDQKRVRAHVIPQPPISSAPEYLVVVERLDEPSRRMDHFVTALNAFVAAGFLFSVIFIIYQANGLLRVFARLDHAIEPLASASGLTAKTRSRDVILRSIEIVETAARDLTEKHLRFDAVASSIGSGTADAGEDLGTMVLASIGVGVLVFDRERMIVSVSAPARTMLRLDMSDPVGRSCEAVFGSDGLIGTMLTEALKEKRTHCFRSMPIDLPGVTKRWVSVSSMLLRSDAGALTGTAFAIMDITDNKQLEERAREQEHLAALGELSAGIAHEIRNPLGVINGNADLLMDEVGSDDGRQIVQAIKDEVSGLNRIITDFLSFARPVQLKVQLVDPVQLCRDAVSEIRHSSPDTVRFAVDAQPGTPPVEMDEALMRQVLLIVLMNAVQAVDDHGVIRLDVSTYPAGSDRSEGGGVRIRVMDSGSGVRPEVFPDLFKPFFTTKQKGTGLGLAIARKIVTLHYGTIEFDPAIRDGACVLIRLPAQYDPDRTIDLHGRG